MRFRLAHKLVTFLLPSLAITTLATSGQISPIRIVLLLCAFTLAWFADPNTRIGYLFAKCSQGIALLTLLLLLVAILQVVRSFPDMNLVPFLDFVFFLLVAKLCQRRMNRDHLQIFVLSLLMMLAAAWMATNAIFLVGFAFFVVLSTWALILFHLRHEIEANYLVRHNNESFSQQITAERVMNSRRVVGPTFFLGTGAMAIFVFLGAAIVFALIPRVGLGFILGGLRRTGVIAGFSDEVKLGRRGTISTDNQTIILRARIPAIENIADDEKRDQAIAGLYWRGTVYDTYSQGEWLRSRQEKTRSIALPTPSNLTFGKSYLLTDPFALNPHVSRKTALQNSTLQHIEIVGLAYPVVFALDRPVAIEVPPPPTGSFFAMDIETRFNGEYNLRQFRVSPSNPFDRQHPTSEFFGGSYLAFSRSIEELAVHIGFADEAQLSADLLQPYLLLPPQVSQRVRDLADEITKGATSSERKISAIVRWLQKTHGYSTTLGRNENIVDPLEDFLFDQTVGHCEYFASAAAVLLRLAGVPTRYVNGFLGGEWNDLQQLVTVRENRAHAWLESYMGKQGWIRVDPTPAQALSTRMNGLRQLLDASELFFSRWVLEYNASQQLRLAESLGRQFGFSGREAIQKPAFPLTRRQAVFLTLAGFALFLLWKTRHWFHRTLKPRKSINRITSRRQSGVIRLYASTLHRLENAGFPRRSSETPHEYLQRLKTQGLEGAPILAELTQFYTEARYGERPTPPETFVRLQAQSPQIRVTSQTS